MKHQFTSVIEKRGRWYVAYIEEIPGINTQGRTLGEARRNLKEALTMVIEANRELAAKQRSAPRTNATSSVPRHAEINDFLARKICRDLGIPQPE
ncbi:MAG TPA: type II toxin-antitoxin system HicB family antitoxin [Candidatus Elarobacter sp.]|nr:type II toxin-antitoxin system HicB family antitoxin [Candidatus Elarobacter sp.]